MRKFYWRRNGYVTYSVNQPLTNSHCLLSSCSFPLHSISSVACKVHKPVKLGHSALQRLASRWVKCLLRNIQESTFMPHVQYFPFPVGSIALFRSMFMKLTFSIYVPNIYEYLTFMFEVILKEQLRLFIALACFGTLLPTWFAWQSVCNTEAECRLGSAFVCLFQAHP
jgi:hypothetical protein